MPQKKIRRLYLICSFVTAILILTVAAALVIGCVNIYKSGDRPFSREAMASMLHRIAIPGWLCLAAVIVTAILHLALPLETEKNGSKRSEKDTLRRYRSKLAELSDDEQKKVNTEVSRRRTYRTITAVIIAALGVYPIVYFSDASHFSVDNLNRDIVRAVMVSLIPAAAALILVYVCARLETASMLREIQLYKKNSIKQASAVPSVKPERTASVRWVILAVAVVLILLGIANGGAADVLGKAIRICTECIGLG